MAHIRGRHTPQALNGMVTRIWYANVITLRSLAENWVKELRVTQLKLDTLMDKVHSLEAQLAHQTAAPHAHAPAPPATDEDTGDTAAHKRPHAHSARGASEEQYRTAGEQMFVLSAMWLQGNLKFGKTAFRENYDKAQHWNPKLYTDGLAQAQLRDIAQLIPGFHFYRSDMFVLTRYPSFAME